MVSDDHENICRRIIWEVYSTVIYNRVKLSTPLSGSLSCI